MLLERLGRLLLISKPGRRFGCLDRVLFGPREGLLRDAFNQTRDSINRCGRFSRSQTMRSVQHMYLLELAITER